MDLKEFLFKQLVILGTTFVVGFLGTLGLISLLGFEDGTITAFTVYAVLVALVTGITIKDAFTRGSK